MKVRCLWFVILAASMSGCSPSNQQLQFKPEAGEKREYRVINHSDISAESSYGPRSEHLESKMIVEYHAKTPREISIRPRYMNMEMRLGNFLSSDSADSHEQPIREWLDGGFTLRLNEDGSLQSFSSNHESTDLFDGADTPDPAIDFIQNELTQPGALVGIPLRQGATRSIRLSDDTTSADIEVLKLTDTEVAVAIAASGKDLSVYGRAVFERDSGWLIRAALISEQSIEDPHGMVVTVRSRSSIFPITGSLFADYGFLSDTYDQEAYVVADLEQALNNDGSQVEPFSGSHGQMEFNYGVYDLSYRHQDMPVEAAFRIKARDAKGFNSDGELLPQDFGVGGSYQFHRYDGDDLQSGMNVYPLGWFEVDKSLEQLAYIDVTLEAYRIEREIVTVSLHDAPSTTQHGDAFVRVERGEHENHYRLFLTPSADIGYGFYISGVDKALMRFSEAENVPEWIDSGESRLLGTIDGGEFLLEYEFIAPGDTTDSIQLVLHRDTAGQPYATETVRFYDPRQVLDTAHLPLPEVSYLYPQYEHEENEWVVFADNRPRLNFEVSATDSMRPIDEGTPQLFWVLSQEQAGSCKLAVDDDRFIWRERTDLTRTNQTNGQVRGKVIFQLYGLDSERNYFYDEAVEVSADCALNAGWQPADVKPDAEFPWLVSLASLDGIEASTPVVELMRQYRFLYSDGQPLAVAPASSEQIYSRIETLNVGDILLDGEHIRLGGEVAAIEKLQQEEERIEHRFQHQFPSLPSADDGLHSDQGARQ